MSLSTARTPEEVEKWLKAYKAFLETTYHVKLPEPEDVRYWTPVWKMDYAYANKISLLTSWIKEAWENNGFVMFFIIGQQGAGKSSLAMKIAYSVYGGWEPVFDYMFFTIPHFLWTMQVMMARSLIDTMKTGETVQYRIPVAIIDDAGVALSRYMPLRAKKTAEEITDYFQVARGQFACIILTAVTWWDIMRPIRQQNYILIQLHRLKPRGRQYFAKVIAVKRYSTVTWKGEIETRAEAFVGKKINVTLPDAVYKRYLKERMTYAGRIGEIQLHGFLEEMKKRGRGRPPKWLKEIYGTASDILNDAESGAEE